MFEKRVFRWVIGVVAVSTAVGCGGTQAEVGLRSSSLEAATLIITEVAQGTSHGGSTADKVEIYCASTTPCPSFKVCDSTSTGGASCSALSPALSSHERVVVSRGTSIATTDQVWLVSASGAELSGTRVGPFGCPNTQGRARADCAEAAFTGCGTPGLGASSGSCESGEFAELFRYDAQFTTNQHGAPETTCTRPVCRALRAAIEQAQTSIEFAVYGLRGQPDIIDALIDAQARGVDVRGVVDSEDGTCTKFGYPDTPLLIQALAPGSVVCDVGGGYSYIMHNKFFVFDGNKVWTGSTNLSDTELGGEYNSDVAVMINSRKLAQIYSTEHAEMFGGQFHHRKEDDTEHVIDTDHFVDGTLLRSYFSPTDHAVINAVLPLIDGAQHTLDIAMFFFTSQPIADAIVAAQARGVQVRMILDAGGASNQYSKHTLLCEAGMAVKTENWGGKSHSKWAVADAAHPDRAAVLFGSMNWTGAGDTDNDENTLYIRNAGLAAKFAEEFERQWTDLAAVPPCTRVSVEGADSSTYDTSECGPHCVSGSCCDGLDNDYDGRVDAAEEACGCADGLDNDGDSYVDAADFDCRDLQDP